MKPENCILSTVLIYALVLSGCAPVTATRGAQVPSPTATIEPSPTPRPEVNVSLNKPVRVSAYWVVDPPERATDGNLQNWWGAGGPAPQWIEVDLEGIYSVSRIRVISQGPTGQSNFQVLGRGPGYQNQLLHVFDGSKSENQTLEVSPEEPWEDLSTIRVELLSGSGWAGLREIQVFSRDDPKPLPAANPTVPSFLAQVDTDALEPITPDNAIRMEQLAMLGRGTINQLGWSPDGATLAAAGSLGIWLYDAAAPDSPPRLLEGHSRDVLTVVFSPDGAAVLSGSQDGTVKQWDAATGNLIRTLSLWDDFSYEVGDQKRDAEVWSMAFSPDGKLLATGALNGTLRLWDLETARQRASLGGHTAQVARLAFSPDGSLLASSGYDGATIVWDVVTRGQRATLSGHQGWARSLAFSPDGSTLASGSNDMTIRLWDAASGEERTVLEGHTGEVLQLAFSQDGMTLASSALDGTLRVWDVESGSQRLLLDQLYGVTGMAISPDGATLASSTGYGTLHLWDTQTGDQRAALFAHTSPVTSVAFNPERKILASGGEDGIVRLWDIETSSLSGVLLGHLAGVTGVAFSPDGMLLASSDFDGTVRLWDAPSGQQVGVLSGHEGFVRCVAFSPDGKIVASGGTDRTVRLWDAVTGEERATLIGHAGEVESVAFSPDGAWLVSASADKSLRIWEVATGAEGGVLSGHLSFVLSTDFSPDGTLLASSGGDHSLRVWNWEVASGSATGRSRFAPIGHGGWVLTVAFSPDGAIVASAGVATTSYMVAPGDVHLYSSETGFPYALLRGHTKRVTSIAFSPDGMLLASGSADGSVRLWGIPSEPSRAGTQEVAQPTAQPSTPTPVAEDPFPGGWAAVDPGDDSNMTLSITRNEDGSYSLTLIDDGARACGVDSAGQPKFGITVNHTGTVRGNVLYAASTSLTCMSSPPSPLQVAVSVNYQYDPATDTLWDSLDQAVWRRQ